MLPDTEQFIIDREGKRTAVVLQLERYRELLAAEEELDCIQAYDAAKASGDDAIPFEDALREIPRKR